MQLSTRSRARWWFERVLPRRGQQKPLAPVLWTACIGVMLVYLAAFAFSTVQRLANPLEVVYGEAVVLDQVHRFGLGQPLYPPPADLPLSVTGYTPVYYLLVAWLQRLTGDVSYDMGRLLSVIATLGSTVALVWSVRQIAGRWWGGLLAGGLFLTQNLTVLLWASLHRVDPLALALSLLGLAMASSGRTNLAVVPLVLSLMTKQTYVEAPLAVCLMLWPRWRDVLSFVGLYGAGVIAAGAAGQMATGGWMVWHTLLANANPLDLEYFAAMFGAFAQFNALPVCAAVALFGLPCGRAERLWRAYFVFAAIEALFTIGKLGASSNYWLELTAATAVLIGVLAVRLGRGSPSGARLTFSPTGLAGMVLVMLSMSIPAYQATVRDTVELRVAQVLGIQTPQQQLAQTIAAEPGELLTDDPGLAVAAGKRVQFEFIIFTILAVQGVWDERPILDAIAARRFGLVALLESLDAPAHPLISSRMTEPVRNAIRGAYAPAGFEAGYWLYRPSAP